MLLIPWWRFCRVAVVNASLGIVRVINMFLYIFGYQTKYILFQDDKQVQLLSFKM